MTRKTSNLLLGFLVMILAAVLCFLLLVLFRGQEPVLSPSGTTQSTAVQPTTRLPVTSSTTVPVTTVPATTSYVPVITPDQVGIYIPADDGTHARKRITEFRAPRTAKTDIDCFEVLASNGDRLDGQSFASIWRGAWESFEGWQTAKIGYHLCLTLENGTVISKTIRKPSDAAGFYDYLEVYIYDDIHQTGWYSHLEDEDMKEETVMSSIKLHSGSRINEVGDIELTAFIYNGEDCFDPSGNYIGAVKQTLCITE